MDTNRHFMVFDCALVDRVDFAQVLETDATTLRKSVDGRKTFVKWSGPEIPACLDDISSKEGPYSLEEMLQILDTPDWKTDPA